MDRETEIEMDRERRERGEEHGQTCVNKKNLGRVFNSRVGCFHSINKLCSIAKLANLELKSRPEQLLGYLP